MKLKYNRVHQLRLTAIALSLAGISSHSAQATSATWSGTANTWATSSNWVGSPTLVPGSGDTATFNNAGGADDTITTGTITIGTILFDTASAATYTLGGATAGTGQITLNDSGAIIINSSVVNNQLINANLRLGTDRTTGSYSLTNNSTTSLLTLAGTITSGTLTGGPSGIKTLNVGGAGDITLDGIISNGASDGVAITKTGAGTLGHS